ncbi:hypothetical protein PCASD_08505 [Puccinia coronata f. sp. avenae]|uniref:Uncharacterized protein n=1 Tax=Puccinia coronata f. sp. avenae TaxID=200324 RepID=A0A2N5UY58_9BASI|nr:hypothetical protein PCASD_08505 [Puccinia coronata f. sp. avenae]
MSLILCVRALDELGICGVRFRVQTRVNDRMTSNQGAYTPLMTGQNRSSRDSTPFDDQ